MVMPEHEMLLVCSRTALSKSQVERIRCLAGNDDINWISILELARLHRTLPLVYNSLQVCADLVPFDFLQEAKRSYQLNCANNLLLLGSLMKIIKVLQVLGIGVVPFKGPILTELVYGNLCLRSFGDLDILISKCDLRQVTDALLENGYRTNYDLPIETYLKIVTGGHHANFVNTESGVVIEVHWEMSGKYVHRAVNMALVEPRAEMVLLENQQLITIGKEDLLVYLCIHGNRHRWEQLDAVCCVSELINRNTDINWDLAFKIARDLGAVRILTLGMLLAERLLGLTVSISMKKNMIDDPDLKCIAEELEDKILDNCDEQQLEMYHLSGILYHFRTLDHLANGIRYGIRKICVPDIYDFRWLPLPKNLWFLYSIIRPLRIFIINLKRIFLSKCPNRGKVKQNF